MLGAHVSERPAKDDPERSVEVRPFVGRECVPLTGPCDRVCKPTDSERDLESLLQSASPGLQVGVAQPVEPRVIGTEMVELLQEPERHHQREERMRDRRVTPIYDAELAAV